MLENRNRSIKCLQQCEGQGEEETQWASYSDIPWSLNYMTQYAQASTIQQQASQYRKLGFLALKCKTTQIYFCSLKMKPEAT